MSSPTFVVTVSTNGNRRSEVWNSSKPFPIGKPFRWILENHPSGVRLRQLADSASPTQTSVLQLTAEMIAKSQAVDLPMADLPGRPPVSIQLRPVAQLPPAYARAPQATPGVGEIRVYACFGSWLIESVELQKTYTGFAHGKKAFTLYSRADEYRIDCFIPGVHMRKGDEDTGSLRVLEVGQAARLKPEEVLGCKIQLGTLSWRFDRLAAPEAVAGPVAPDTELRWFQHALRGSLFALIAFTIASFLWPAAEKKPAEELIPPQYAKIVMSQPAKSEPAAAGAETQNPALQNLPKTVEKAAVVQAFRAKALQNAVSGLLKGGMTSLLAQSDFVAGAGATANARRLFDSKSDSLRATGQEVGLMNSRKVAVGSLGGAGGGAGGVGYGKGEKAGVKGQGKTQVSLDTGASDVAEGLTKDEVGEVIHRHMSEVRYCYESAMIRTPDIEGKLMVAFTIGGNGVVKTSAVKSSTLPDPRLDDCILRRLMTWKFPNPKGGIDVAVTYPFIFKTLGR